MSSVALQNDVVTNRRATILFVDDEERVTRLLKMMFRGAYDVLTAVSGAEAVEILTSRHIDVIVSDQRMPQMTGIELLSIARERSPQSVRILLTGYSDLVAIIGAVNEGEVFRFLNKPWDQKEITDVIAEAVALAQATREVPADIPVTLPANDEPGSPYLASAAKLLALDGLASNRHEIMEMFTEEYRVVGAETLSEAIELLGQHNIGVVVTNAAVDGIQVVDLLASLREVKPSITVVVVTDTAESDTVIKLINDASIYRFAMKPIQPNVFRLAVHAAMKEHHRRLADPRLNGGADPSRAGQAEGATLVDSIVDSLSRFTKIWQRGSGD